MKLAFLDTETTSLRPDRRAWEIGLIMRPENGKEEEFHWFVTEHDLDLGNADSISLKIGRFYERHPGYAYPHDPFGFDTEIEANAMADIERLTRGAHIVGAVPNFDTEVLGNRMRANNICPSWHYHLIDIEALAAGYLAAKGTLVRLPWKSDDLSRAVGVEPPGDEDRHTALGDARWARRLYDALMAEGDA